MNVKGPAVLEARDCNFICLFLTRKISFFKNYLKISCLGSISRPTFESTNPDDLRVYLGLHNKQKVDADGSVEAPAKYSAISKVVMVKWNQILGKSYW